MTKGIVVGEGIRGIANCKLQNENWKTKSKTGHNASVTAAFNLKFAFCNYQFAIRLPFFTGPRIPTHNR